MSFYQIPAEVGLYFTAGHGVSDVTAEAPALSCFAERLTSGSVSDARDGRTVLFVTSEERRKLRHLLANVGQPTYWTEIPEVSLYPDLAPKESDLFTGLRQSFVAEIMRHPEAPYGADAMPVISGQAAVLAELVLRFRVAENFAHPYQRELTDRERVCLAAALRGGVGESEGLGIRFGDWLATTAPRSHGPYPGQFPLA